MSESPVAVRIAVAASIAVHLAVLAAGLGYTGSLFAPSRPEESIAVDLVTPQDMAEITDPAAVEPPAPEPAKEQALIPEPPKPAAPEPQANAAPTKPASQTKPDLQTKPEAKLDLRLETTTETSNNPQQQTASSPLPPADQPPPAQVPPMPPPDLTVKYGIDPTLLNPNLLGRLPGDFDAKATSAARIDSNDITAFRAHLKTCAKLPAGVAPDDKVVIVLRALFQPDGRLSTAPVLIEASASAKGPLLMQAAIAALQACQPYASLPADKYQEWKMLDLSFTPLDFRRS
jgi:outer membrane biosynthesis protein TonB